MRASYFQLVDGKALCYITRVDNSDAVSRQSPSSLVFSTALALLVMACAPVTARAIQLIGTNGTNLYKFDSTAPATVTTTAITGMVSGDFLIGLDYRPSTGELYGVGNGRLYRINPSTGAAANVAGPSAFNLSGGTFGTDVSPIDDTMRIVSNTNQNIRVSFSSPLVVTTDTNLSQSGTPSNVAAIAFSSSFPYATNTTCYAIGSVDGQLLRIGSANGSPSGPESGAVTKIGSLGIGTGFNQEIGFEIGPDGVGYAAINVGGQLRLYTVNLSTGTASLAGSIGGAATTLRGLTTATGPKVFSNPSLIRIPKPVEVAGEEPTDKADPYPSGISVSGLSGVVTTLRVFINDFRHKSTDDVSMLLVSPDGARRMVIWSEVGGDNSTCGSACDNNDNPGFTGVFITLDDTASDFLSEENSLGGGCNFGCSNTGTFKPTNYGGTSFSPPAPGSGYVYAGPVNGNATLASAFNGTQPNGTWSLYVKDPFNVGSEEGTGRIVSGWQIEISSGAPCTISCSNLTRSAMPGQCGTTVNYPAPNVSGACGTISYSIPSGSMFPVGTTPVEMTSSFGQKCTFNVNVTDFQPPAITCPADLTVQAQPGQNSAVVTYEAMATDNCSGVTVVYDPPSGSSFPVGTTEVRATANDTTGESISCMFNVTVTPGGAATPTPTPTPGSGSVTKLANISTRLRVGTGEDVLIGGFIITGAEAKRLIVRAIGPSLPVGDRLLDPNLELYNSGGDLLASNNNWKDAQNQQEIFETTIAPAEDLESAVLTTVDPGAYTAIVSGVDGGTGVGLVEAYDLALNANSKFANIATRGSVQTGENVMIGGFIILGPDPQKLLVRAIGPSLSIDSKLTDPVLELYDGNGELVASNNNWQDTQQGEIEATGIPPANDLEAAVLASVAPAAYTAIVREANDATGVAVVEVYALDN